MGQGSVLQGMDMCGGTLVVGRQTMIKLEIKRQTSGKESQEKRRGQRKDLAKFCYMRKMEVN